MYAHHIAMVQGQQKDTDCLFLIYRDCTPGFYYITPGPEKPCVFSCAASTTCIVAPVPEEHLRVSKMKI